jgi:hypothetical protein
MRTVILTTWNDIEYYFIPEKAEFISSEINDSFPVECTDQDFDSALEIKNRKNYLGNLKYEEVELTEDSGLTTLNILKEA